MYRSYYGLVKRPFDNVPDPDFYLETAHTKEAYDCLTFSVLQEGMVSLLIGKEGCGKTLLLRRLLKEMEETCELAYVSGSLGRPEELLCEILYQLGREGEEPQEKKEMLRILGTHLYDSLASGKKTLLVFDSVTGITRDDVLAELKRLLDLQLDDRALASFLIAGNGEVESAISSSRMRERVSVIARVRPLTLIESISYIDHRLQAAGSSRVLFTDEAKAALAAASGGIPGQLNALADLCLYYGYRAALPQVDLRVVDMAISRSLTDEIQGSTQKT